ncbi:MAG: hypothetical protein LBR75_04895, partial [Prevotellaceae bacterium]|nr:hypothetical protein [Prevotellaceae bacterium]
MKKLSLICIAAAAFLFTACEYNEENFEGLDTVSAPKNVTVIDYTLTDADYNTIASASSDTEAADFIKANKYFSETYPAANYAIHLLNGSSAPAEMKYADEGSAIRLTYNYFDANDTIPETGLNIVERFTLKTADYDEMGTDAGQPGELNNFSPSINPDNYLPTWLMLHAPYTAKEGAINMIRYRFRPATGAPQTKFALYRFDGIHWLPYTPHSKTEQFIKSGGKWNFDPTINYTLVTADYKMMVDYIKATKPEFEEPANYDNEEFLYGFSSRYSNIAFGLKYRDPYLQYDPELAAATSDEEKLEILWKRLNEEGMIKFLQLKYPEAVAQVSG